jgi:hypothetical protein
MKKQIDVYRNDAYLRSMKPDEFYNLTSDAIWDIKTIKFRLDVTKQTWDTIEARGIHEYKTIDNFIEKKEIKYKLRKRNGRWVITLTGFYEPEVNNLALHAFLGNPSVRQMMNFTPFMIGNGFSNRGVLSIAMIGAFIPLVTDETSGYIDVGKRSSCSLGYFSMLL